MKKEFYSTAKTVQTALRLSEILGEKQRTRPPQLVHLFEISRNTVHRVLKTLREMNFVEEDLPRDTVSASRYLCFGIPFSIGITDLIEHILT